MIPATDLDMRALVKDKRIAIVGNAPEIMQHAYGEEIDGHDVVIRMNRALPETEEQRRHIGSITTVLTGGIVHPIETLPFVPPWIWWFKHTPLGARHVRELNQSKRFDDTHFWRIDRDDLGLLRDSVGTPPSSTISAFWTCRHYEALSIDLFGVTCWGRLEPGSSLHWWTYAPEFEAIANMQQPHGAEKEAEWLRRRVSYVGPTHYRVNMP